MKGRRIRNAGTAGVVKTNLQPTFASGTPTYGHTIIDQLAKTHKYRICFDTGCSLKRLPDAMDERDRWLGRESGNSVLSV